MSSIIKVDTIKDIASTDIIKKSGTSITVGTASDTTTVAGNAVRSNAIQAADGQNIISQVGTTITLGATGDTVEIATGATLVGGGITWQSVVTASTLTTVAGRGYPINTTSNACTVTLPSSASAGDQVQIVDYAGTFATNNITLTSSLNIEGGISNKALTTNREGVIITYVDVTQGWVATTGVNSGNQALDPVSYSADFLVIAGAGGGGFGGGYGGGGGAGGYRNSYNSETSGGGGSSESSLTFVGGTVYTVTVGAGGVGGTSGVLGGNGVNSSISGSGISTITSTGGGGGGHGMNGNTVAGASGGSGGGAGEFAGTYAGASSGTANQGFGGGASGNIPGGAAAGGGGGAGEAGNTDRTGDGGDGLASSITGSSIFRGGGGAAPSTGYTSSGGDGGGASILSPAGIGSNGTVNTGGGGAAGTSAVGGIGGKGVVILRMPTVGYSGTTTGSPTVSTAGTDTILTFNDSGSYTG